MSADEYLKTLRIEENPSVRSRAAGILDRVEMLKRASTTLPLAPSAPPLRLMTERPRPQTSISQSQPLLPEMPVQKYTSEPVSAIATVVPAGGGFSQSEKQILKNSSRINGKLFLPWLDGEEDREKFRFEKPFTDPDGLLPLSAEMESQGAQWKRPRDLLRIPTSSLAAQTDADMDSPTTDSKPAIPNATASDTESTPKPIVMIRRVDAMSVSQDLVSDCSFVCSLCIAADFERKFKKQLITKIIYPQKAGVPVFNAYGKYLVKLFLNGVYRKVIVDDFLPVGPQNQLLCSSGEYNDQSLELWVSIIEKAYMKVNGGYDFPGSNSGIDLYALTGWIPEQVFFAEDRKDGLTLSISPSSETGVVNARALDHRQPEDRAWERMESALSFGDCLVTISTGPKIDTTSQSVDGKPIKGLTAEDELTTGLVPGHAYAVLDVQNVCGLRLMKVKNPWARKPWKGRFSQQDSSSWTPALKSALGLKESELNQMSSKGIFWIEFTDCRTYFKSFFLNCTNYFM